MRAFDVGQRIVRPSNKKHSQHKRFLQLERRRARRLVVRRSLAATAFGLLSALILLPQLVAGQQVGAQQTYHAQADVQNLRTAALVHTQQLPLQQSDPKVAALTQYLVDKGSPLAKYAGELARMPNWKTLVGIAAAESSLCKKTARNNCWGIGPNNTPLTYDDISQSLYYANYLLNKYSKLGMNPAKPETIVRTYVGYDHATWVSNVESVFAELAERGLQ